jgi:hypothetical protein
MDPILPSFTDDASVDELARKIEKRLNKHLMNQSTASIIVVLWMKLLEITFPAVARLLIILWLEATASLFLVFYYHTIYKMVLGYSTATISTL